jgi:energy-converting hydrogenase Eha subunit F
MSLHNPPRRNDALLAEFDRIGISERERSRAKAQYLQIEALIDRIFDLGSRLAKGRRGRR